MSGQYRLREPIGFIMKLYIAVLDEVPANMVPVLVAHAVLGADTEFLRINDFDGNYAHWDNAISYKKWKSDSFKKCVLKVNRKEFEKISLMSVVYLAHENTTLNGIKSCAVVCPREVYPNVIRFAKLYSF
jgi:hypothetical protein